MRKGKNIASEPGGEKKNTEKFAKVLEISRKAISLHPQSRNDGGIAQLVRAHDS